MYDLQYLRHGVTRGRGQSAFVYRLNNFQIINVIADVRHMVYLSARLVTDATEVPAFIVYTLKQVSKLEFGSSALQA